MVSMHLPLSPSLYSRIDPIPNHTKPRKTKYARAEHHSRSSYGISHGAL